MRGLSALLLSAVLICVVHAQDRPRLSVEHEIMELERQGWEAAQNRDSSTAQRLLTDDALDVGEYGIWNAKRSAESVASLEKHPNSALAEYSISDWKFRQASDKVVVVAYKVTLINVLNNVRQRPVVQYYSAVWVHQGNAWRKPSVSQLHGTGQA